MQTDFWDKAPKQWSNALNAYWSCRVRVKQHMIGILILSKNFPGEPKKEGGALDGNLKGETQ